MSAILAVGLPRSCLSDVIGTAAALVLSPVALVLTGEHATMADYSLREACICVGLASAPFTAGSLIVAICTQCMATTRPAEANALESMETGRKKMRTSPSRESNSKDERIQSWDQGLLLGIGTAASLASTGGALVITGFALLIPAAASKSSVFSLVVLVILLIVLTLFVVSLLETAVRAFLLRASYRPASEVVGPHATSGPTSPSQRVASSKSRSLFARAKPSAAYEQYIPTPPHSPMLENTTTRTLEF
jgi:hypothetical protein